MNMRNFFLVIISVVCVNVVNMHCMMMKFTSEKKIKIAIEIFHDTLQKSIIMYTGDYCNNFTERNFCDNAKKFELLPEKSCFKIFQLFDEKAKFLLYFTMLPEELRLMIVYKMFGLNAVNAHAQDVAAVRDVYAKPVGQFLRVCNQKTQQAAQFPIVLDNKQMLFAASHINIHEDYAKMLSKVTRTRCITQEDIQSIPMGIPFYILEHKNLKNISITTILSFRQKIDLLKNSLIASMPVIKIIALMQVGGGVLAGCSIIFEDLALDDVMDIFKKVCYVGINAWVGLSAAQITATYYFDYPYQFTIPFHKIIRYYQ